MNQSNSESWRSFLYKAASMIGNHGKSFRKLRLLRLGWLKRCGFHRNFRIFWKYDHCTMWQLQHGVMRNIIIVSKSTKLLQPFNYAVNITKLETFLSSKVSIIIEDKEALVKKNTAIERLFHSPTLDGNKFLCEKPMYLHRSLVELFIILHKTTPFVSCSRGIFYTTA